MKKLISALLLLLCLTSAALAEESLYPAIGENGLYGYINADADWVIAPQFDWAGEFRGNYAPFCELPEGMPLEERWNLDCEGIIDREGHIVLEPCYTLAGGQSGEFFGGKDTGIWLVFQFDQEDAPGGFFDIPSGCFSGLRWGEVWQWVSDSDLIPVHDPETYLSGYASRSTGEMVIPCQYGSFMPSVFEGGVAAVLLEGEDGDPISDPFLINEQGETIPLPEGYMCYEGCSGAEGRIAVYNAQEQIGFVDPAGSLVIEGQFDAVNDFCEGFAAVLFPEGDEGFIDLNGTVLARGFEDVNDFCCGYAEVVEDGVTRYLRPDGSFAPFSGEGYYFFSETRGWLDVDLAEYGSEMHLVNERGEVLTEVPVLLTEMEPSSFEGGLQAVRIDGKYGYIDLDGRVVIPCIYGYAENFNGGLGWVRLGDRVGYIDRTGNEVYMWDEPVE